ncbi:efflux RND transporter periplasmic adaptor subunit [Marivita sp.]|uniref:efflux RND transporter periplasmic adaptor subunit n=1 Tax=Marivita sp. TaxID=2003365 RepID=UPI0025BDA278|nr:efflux RND transporter periplasmic adaptor subunit [Marivita sp.]
MTKTVFFTLGGLALLAAGIAAAYFARGLEGDAATDPPQAPLVETVRPEPASAPPAIVETGFVRAAERIEVAPEIGGRIVEIGSGFSLGSMVAEGALLVRLDASTIETEIARAEADLNSAEAAEAQAEAELQRNAQLAEENIAAEAELERARADAAAARARVEQAEAALQAAELRLDDTRLRAPFDALVTEEDASVGQLLQVGAPIGTLVASNVAEVRVGLTEDNFRRLRRNGDLEGRSVEIQREGREPLSGTVAALAPVLEGQARTVDVVIEVADPFAEDRDLVLNALVTVSIPLPDSDQPLFRLPDGALHAGERLWRVTQDDTLEPVSARIQRRGDNSVYVISDMLTEDDRILLTEITNPLPGRAVRTDSGSADQSAENDGGSNAEAGE